MIDPDPRELTYYASTSPMTDLGPHADLASTDDVAELCALVQGWLMHPFHAHRYGIEVPPDAERQLQCRSAREILASVLASDASVLTKARRPEKRAYGNCRHFATLLTALLRERGIPARSRCGFGAYFSESTYDDHWITEMWDGAQQRWRLVDPQIDAVQRDGMGLSVDTLDLSREDFWVAGQAWHRCRQGQNDPQDFGILDMWGLWFIRSNLVRDLAALSRIELLPWDAWGLMLSDEKPDPHLALLDRVAEVTIGDSIDGASARALYAEHEALRVPQKIFSYQPAPGPVDLGELAGI